MDRGVLLVLAASVWFGGSSMLLKALGPGVPTAWPVFLRNCLALPALLAALRWQGVPLGSPNWRLLVLRGVWGVLSMACYFWSVPRMPLADSVLISQSGPLFAALWGVLFLGERLDAPGVGFVALACSGVLVTLAPALRLSGPPAPYLAALGAGLFGSAALASVRSLTRTEASLRIIVFFSLVGSAAFLPGVLASGYLPGAGEFRTMVGVGACATVGQVFLTAGLRRAPVSRAGLATLFILVVNILGGWLFWEEVPGATTWAGCFLVAAGIFGLARRPHLPKAPPTAVLRV